MQLQESEGTKLSDQPSHYKLQAVPVTIECEDYKLTLPACTLEFNEDCYRLISASEGSPKTISILYKNTTSIGSSGLMLLAFLGDQQDNQDQDCQLLTLIDQSPSGNFNLQGCYSLSIDMEKYGNMVLQEVYQLLTNYLGSAEEEDNDDEALDEMISMDTINQNGEVVKPMPPQEEQEEEEQDQLE